MKASVLKTSERTEIRNDRNLGIQTYGENNDYPQRVREIVNASGTGKSCLSIYTKFIAGRGFKDQSFYKAIINSLGQTNDYILSQVSKDYGTYGGFTLHVNYNSLFKAVEIQHVPFETARFEKLDDNGEFNKIAVHPDWGRRFQALRRFKKEDIKFYDLYNPDPKVIAEQVEAAGGWDKWNGQILYFSEAGEKVYPVPVFDPEITDMSTEEGIANVKYRNARCGFMPGGMVVDKRNKAEDKEQESSLERSLKELQGDEKAGKWIYVEVDNEVETPEFIPLETKNYDKEFDYSEKSVQDNIGMSFKQPPILRGKDVGGNFGADLMTNAYNFYNSITEPERIAIERIFNEIFSHYYLQINPSNDYSIIPLVFGGSNNQYADNSR